MSSSNNRIITTSDKYDITNFMLELAKKHNEDIDESTLLLSQFGFMIESFSNILQSSIVSANLWSREAFPLLATKERSIMTNVATYDIKNINSTPARMEVRLSILEEDLDNLFTSNSTLNSTTKEDIIIDKACPFIIAGYEFHLEYDLILTRIKNNDDRIIYTARYNIDDSNPTSTITNAYLLPPEFFNLNGDTFLGIYVTLCQYKYETHDVEIIEDNLVTNKTCEFGFTGDLSWFTVSVTDKNSGEETSLDTVIDGMPYESDGEYCFYTYLDRYNIRLKFNTDCYYPSSKSTINITTYTSSGEDANFEYKGNQNLIFNLTSEKYDYNDTQVLITPLTNSSGGKYGKDINEIKNMIPKEILSRKVITTETDLYNYFNTLDNNIVKFYKRRHNQIDHLYYAYIVAKDIDENVIPTNTINIMVGENELSNIESDDTRFIIPTGTVFKQAGNSNTYKIVEDTTELYEEEKDGFIYILPVNIILNKYPISTSYYMDIMDNDIELYMTYINNNSIMHAITNYMNMSKVFLDDKNYHFRTTINQSINEDMGVIVYNEEKISQIEETNIKAVLLIKKNDVNYYVYGDLVEYDKENFSYTFDFTLESEPYINKESNFRINNVHIEGTGDLTYVDLTRETEIEFLYFIKFENSYGLDKYENIIPGLEGWTLVNKYEPKDPIELYYNYSDVMSSYVSYNNNSNHEDGFTINKVPVVKYSYFKNRNKCLNFIENIHYKKVTIDSLTNSIIKPFGIDFKFFNTYGYSNIYNVGHSENTLDKVNISLEFNIRLYPEASESTITNIQSFIKEYIENLNDLDESIHITNLTTEITNMYKDDIEFIEFVKINNYSSNIQYFKRKDDEYITSVPEFINIDLNEDYTSKIKINLI